MRGSRFSCLVLILTVQSTTAQTISRAYLGGDKKAHIVFANGTEKVLPPEPQQVGCDDIVVSPDKHTVGWSVLVENCCTSYQIPTSLVLYSQLKKTVISPGQMIFEWHFVSNDRVAVLFGPVHGVASGAKLYGTHGGKLLASWDGRNAAPAWAQSWKQQFEH